MKVRLLGVVLLLASVFLPLNAQAPAGTPAGSTGVCNDGTYSSAASRRGACAGHQGVKSWYAPASAAPATQSAPSASAAAPSTSVSKTPSAAAPKAQAPGGGDGRVWVNTKSNVYHCQGDRNYGTTKAGQYMSEADAKSKGARPAYGKTCSK